MRIHRRLALGLIAPIVFFLAGCSGPNLQEDPRQSKFAPLLDGKYNDAVKVLDAELGHDPNSLQAQYCRATVEVEGGNLQDGIDRLDKLLLKYPDYSFGYSERSRANYKAGHYEQAIADADLAIHYRPDVARNYLRRAVAYLMIHKADKAIEDLDMATKAAPTEDQVYITLLRGRALMDLRQYREALPVLSSSVSHAGKDARPYVQRALCYAHLKDWHNALADANQAAKLQPDELSVKVLQAALLSATGHREEARKELLPALKSSPEAKVIAETADLGPDSSSVADAALACLSAGNAKEAKAILTLVETNRPLESEELYALAKAELAENDLFRAAKLLNECIAIEPMWAQPRVDLIRLYLRDNLPQKARELQKEGLELPLPAKARKMIASAI